MTLKECDVRWGDPNKTPLRLSPELDQLCDEFLKQGIEFAEKFAELANIPKDEAPTIQGAILVKCSEAITKARLAALELLEPQSRPTE